MMNGRQRATLLVSCLPKPEADCVLTRLARRRANSIRRGLAAVVGDDPTENVVDTFLLNVKRTRARKDVTIARPFASLADWLPSQWADRLKSELDQTIATVLQQLPPSRAADVLAQFSDERQVKIVDRLIDLQPVPDALLYEVEEILSTLPATTEGENQPGLDRNGAQHVARMLRYASDETKQRLARELRQHRNDAA